jgi:hypothetical protein
VSRHAEDPHPVSGRPRFPAPAGVVDIEGTREGEDPVVALQVTFLLLGVLMPAGAVAWLASGRLPGSAPSALPR